MLSDDAKPKLSEWLMRNESTLGDILHHRMKTGNHYLKKNIRTRPKSSTG
jgi:hypothetical protein